MDCLNDIQKKETQAIKPVCCHIKTKQRSRKSCHTIGGQNCEMFIAQS